MKTKNVLAAIVCLFAIGSAVASEYLVPRNAYSRIVDSIPEQTANCELRGQCDGTAVNCIIFIDHDANPSTPDVGRQMYSLPTGTCGVALFED